MKILKSCRKGGRKNWPVEAMLNAFYALLVLQYRSMADLQRNLASNPTLMRICGFELKPSKKGKFRVPSMSALSRFWILLRQVEDELDVIRAMFYHNRDLLKQACPDFGESLGFDGKKLHSHSTGRTRADGTFSDADADWGRHDYRGKDAKGNDWCKTVTWFGYKLHLVADTSCELPFDFRVEKANSSETKVCQEMVAEILLDEEVRERCVDFVADCGLDSNSLRRQLHENGVMPLV